MAFIEIRASDAAGCSKVSSRTRLRIGAAVAGRYPATATATPVHHEGYFAGKLLPFL
jgi:hypothetical protein